MRLAKKTHYGIQLLVSLARREDEWVSLKTLATDLHLSLAFLKHIAVALKRSRILKSQGGLHGGYRLGQSVDQINLAMILRALNEPVRLQPCKTKQCNHQKCLTGIFWESVSNNLQSAFEGTSLQVVVESVPALTEKI